MADLVHLSQSTGPDPQLSTHLATKNYTDASRGDVTINPRTGGYTLVLGDRGGMVEVNSASTATVTVPSNASVAFPLSTVVRVRKTGTGNVNIVGAVGVTIDWASSSTISTRYTIAEIHKNASDHWFGMLVGA